MQLSSEVVIDYFLQTSLMVNNKNNNNSSIDQQNQQQLPLRDRARSEVSTSVFKSDDAATLRTSPNFALNEGFLFQRWLFTVARRSVLAMRCFTDLAADPARSEWTKMLQEAQIAQQRVKIAQEKIKQQRRGNSSSSSSPSRLVIPSNETESASGGLWCQRRSIWRAAHDRTRVEMPQAVVSALNHYEIAEMQHFGAVSSQIESIDPNEVTLQDAITTFEGMMKDCGVPSLSELDDGNNTATNDNDDDDIYKTNTNANINTNSSDGANNNSGNKTSSSSSNLMDSCERVAKRWRKEKEDAATSSSSSSLWKQAHSNSTGTKNASLPSVATWPYDTQGVIWKDVVEAVRFVLGCGNLQQQESLLSVEEQQQQGEEGFSTPALQKQQGNMNNKPSVMSIDDLSQVDHEEQRQNNNINNNRFNKTNRPPTADSVFNSNSNNNARRKLDSASSSVGGSRRNNNNGHLFSSSSNNANNNNNNIGTTEEQRRLQIQQLLQPKEQSSEEELRLEATSVHWIRSIAAVVISVCFGDFCDCQQPGSFGGSLPPISGDFVREMLSCILEMVSLPSSSLFHEKAVLTLAAYLEFQNKLFQVKIDSGKENSSNDSNFFPTAVDFSETNQNSSDIITTLKSQILHPFTYKHEKQKQHQQQQNSSPARNKNDNTTSHNNFSPSRTPHHSIINSSVTPPWWFYPEPPFIQISWSDVDTADLVKTFAVAFPSISLIPGYTRPFDAVDRAHLESHLKKTLLLSANQQQQKRNDNGGDDENNDDHDNYQQHTDDILDSVAHGLDIDSTSIFVKNNNNSNHLSKNLQTGGNEKNRSVINALAQPPQVFAFTHNDDHYYNGENNNNNHEKKSQSQYVDQVTRRRIERLRRKYRDEKALAMAAQIAAPAPSLVSPSLSRLTAAARGHQADRVFLKNTPILPLSKDDEAEAAQLELTLQKKAQDWVKDQRPKFASSSHNNQQSTHYYYSTTPNNNNTHHRPHQKELDSLIRVRPWIGSAKPRPSTSQQQQRPSTTTTLPTNHVKLPRSSSPKNTVSNLISKQQNLIHSASSTPWCVTNAFPSAHHLNCESASGTLLAKNRRQLAVPLGNGTKAREKVKARILAEVIAEQKEHMALMKQQQQGRK